MIETKQIRLLGNPNGEKWQRREYEKCQREIQDYIAFGWQATQQADERHGRTTSHYQILARETSMPHYSELRQCESEYENAKSNIKIYVPMEFTTAILLLIIFIIPGVIYILFKMMQKGDINANNQMCYQNMNDAVNRARSIQFS